MNIYSCPSCAATVQFRSPDTNLAVCQQCQKPLQRWDDNILTVAKELETAKNTLTPLQPGTTGVWKDKRFTITGRVQCELQDGSQNLWSMYMEDGTLHLLAESYGQFAVCEKIALEKTVSANDLKYTQIGSGKDHLQLFGYQYIIERKDRCKRITVEGEAWVFNFQEEFIIHEVAATNNDRLALLDLGADQYLYFRLHYVSYENFGFHQLRIHEMGRVVQTHFCPQCHNTIEQKAFPLSQSFVCKHCNTAWSYHKGSLTLRKRMSLEKTPAMPLYTSGKLKGIEYELVGFAEKQDMDGYGWQEYTLFNALRGFAFLSEYAGHWIFLREERRAPVTFGEEAIDVDFEGKIFLPYNKYRFSVSGARGEFPADAFDGATDCVEYINPPHMWAREEGKQGVEWFFGEHISQDELYAAFGSAITLPAQVGVGALQPVKGTVNLRWFRGTMIGTVLLFFIAHLASIAFNKAQTVYEVSPVVPDTSTNYSIVTPKFTLDKWRSNLEIALSAPVSNNWFEVNITLVNADNGKEYTMEAGVEYYSGYEGGESWSEGSTSTEQMFTSIPKGTYFMEIIASKPLGASPPSFSLTATYDVPMNRNFFVFLLIGLVPGIVWYLYLRNKEGLRWANSPFAPAPLFNFETNDE